MAAKALARAPDDRYADAGELAEDLDALLALRPVSARAPGALRRAVSWARSHRAAAAAVAAVLVSVLSLAAGALVAAQREDTRRRDSARGERETAAALLAEFAGDRAAEEELAASVRARLAAYPVEARTRAEWDELDRDRAELRRRRDARAAAFDDALGALERADELDPSHPETTRLRASLGAERFRLARAAGDVDGERTWRAFVERHDREGVHATLLAGLAPLTVRTDPPGAEVQLFRYHPLDELVPGAEPRLVAVSVDGPPAPVEPGSWCLRPAPGTTGAKGEGVDVDDRVVALAGHPIEGSVFVTAGDAVPLLSRLVRIDDEPITASHQTEVHWSPAGTPVREEERAFVFATPDGELALTARRIEELGLEVADARVAAALGGPATVVREGELVELELPPGLAWRTTASPLFASAQPSATTPLERELEAGAYVALVRSPGRPDLRVPFELRVGEPSELRVALPPAASPPAEFVPLAHGSGVVWLQDRETTLGEWVEFLNDPETQARIELATEPILFPRDVAGGGAYIPRQSDGAYLIPPQYDELTPIFAIHYFDAVAFAEWRTERARIAGEPWSFHVPELAEVEATRRVHPSRQWIAGATFRPHWIKSLNAAPGVRLEPVLSYPVDETPHGVFDLTGSIIEWTSTAHDGDESRRDLVGGAWAHDDPMLFQSSHTTSSGEELPYSVYGLRLVARYEGASAD